MVFGQSIEAMCKVENEDVFGAAPTGDAPTTSELSIILLPTKVRLMLEVLRYMVSFADRNAFMIDNVYKGVVHVMTPLHCYCIQRGPG